jgi:hypothetical protein
MAAIAVTVVMADMGGIDPSKRTTADLNWACFGAPIFFAPCKCFQSAEAGPHLPHSARIGWLQYMAAMGIAANISANPHSGDRLMTRIILKSFATAALFALVSAQAVRAGSEAPVGESAMAGKPIQLAQNTGAAAGTTTIGKKAEPAPAQKSEPEVPEKKAETAKPPAKTAKKAADEDFVKSVFDSNHGY